MLENSNSLFVPAEAQDQQAEVGRADAAGLGGGWRAAHVHGAKP